MRLRGPEKFENGLHKLVTLDGKYKDMLMDYYVLAQKKGDVFEDNTELEKVYLLMQGSVEFSWLGESQKVTRTSFLDETPVCMHLPAKVALKVTALSDKVEIAIVRTENCKFFEPKLYVQGECRVEIRGKGQMNEAGTRIVRTILDHQIIPEANIMIGEDVHYPGKWSGFPSHHHPQPEIYFYKFYPEQGFGLIKLGDEGVLLEHNDTLLIQPGKVHPQVAAPGYAMYYIWAIRHLEGNPYIAPVFEEKHLWVEKPDAVLWPDK